MNIALGAACLALGSGLLPAADSSHIRYSPSEKTWTLASGPVAYRLRQGDDGVRPVYFGPAGRTDWPAPDPSAQPAYDTFGVVEWERVRPQDLRLEGADTPPGGLELALRYRHQHLPLEMAARYLVQGDTGVITRRVTLMNRGTSALQIQSWPSLALQLPAGDYDLHYLYGGWGQERQLVTDHDLPAGGRVFIADRGRSTNGYVPWFALRNLALQTTYMAQLAWSGNWRMTFDRAPSAGRVRLNQMPLTVDLGMSFDAGGALTLPPGASFELPEVAFTATPGDLDDAANQMHRYQRQFVIPHRPTGDPLMVQFNSWYPFADKVPLGELKRSADVAAELGIETFVLDSGWYNRQDWSRELGDYQPDPAKFPHGLQELSNYVRSKGMKFGLWVEIENAGVDSVIARAHPDWFLMYHGAPILKDQRHQLNFGKPEVRQWARATVDRLVRDYNLDWIKIDYNIDIGQHFDPSGDGRAGDILYRHVRGYYTWLDELRAAHPGLLLESCSSGGLRFDLGILAHAHTTWLSDAVAPRESLQLGYGCTVEFAPEVCNHWMVGDDDHGQVDASKPPGWWEFMFRVPMNGQFGISSRIFEWSPDLRGRAAANIAAYKRIRPVIDGADVYHLTPQPDHNDPQGWMAIQYVAPDGRRSVVLAYRLGNSAEEQQLKLRGLARGASKSRSMGSPPARTLRPASIVREYRLSWVRSGARRSSNCRRALKQAYAETRRLPSGVESVR